MTPPSLLLLALLALVFSSTVQASGPTVYAAGPDDPPAVTRAKKMFQNAMNLRAAPINFDDNTKYDYEYEGAEYDCAGKCDGFTVEPDRYLESHGLMFSRALEAKNDVYSYSQPNLVPLGVGPYVPLRVSFFDDEGQPGVVSGFGLVVRDLYGEGVNASEDAIEYFDFEGNSLGRYGFVRSTNGAPRDIGWGFLGVDFGSPVVSSVIIYLKDGKTDGYVDVEMDDLAFNPPVSVNAPTRVGGQALGDPHYITLDGTLVTCNDLGWFLYAQHPQFSIYNFHVPAAPGADAASINLTRIEFTSGEPDVLIDAVLASSAVPTVFNSGTTDEVILQDGVATITNRFTELTFQVFFDEFLNVIITTSLTLTGGVVVDKEAACTDAVDATLVPDQQSCLDEGLSGSLLAACNFDVNATQNTDFAEVTRNFSMIIPSSAPSAAPTVLK